MLKNPRKATRVTKWRIAGIFPLILLLAVAFLAFAPLRLEETGGYFRGEKEIELASKLHFPDAGGWVAQYTDIPDGKGLDPGIYGIYNDWLVRVDLTDGHTEKIIEFRENEETTQIGTSPDNRYLLIWSNPEDSGPRFSMYDGSSSDWVVFKNGEETAQWVDIETMHGPDDTRIGEVLFLHGRYYIFKYDMWIENIGDYYFADDQLISYYNVFDITEGAFTGFGTTFNAWAEFQLVELSEDKKHARFLFWGDYMDNPLRPDKRSFLRYYDLDTDSGEFIEHESRNLSVKNASRLVVSPSGDILLYDIRLFGNELTNFWFIREGRETTLLGELAEGFVTIERESFFEKSETLIVDIREDWGFTGTRVISWFDYQGADGGTVGIAVASEDYINYMNAHRASVLCFPVDLEVGDNDTWIKYRFFDTNTRQAAGEIELIDGLQTPKLHLTEGDYFPDAGKTIRAQFDN